MSIKSAQCKVIVLKKNITKRDRRIANFKLQLWQATWPCFQPAEQWTEMSNTARVKEGERGLLTPKLDTGT